MAFRDQLWFDMLITFENHRYTITSFILLETPTTTQTTYYVCIYIYIYRERERDTHITQHV